MTALRSDTVHVVIMYDLTIISCIVIALALVKFWEILRDCRERRKKNKKIRELKEQKNGGRPTNTSAGAPN